MRKLLLFCILGSWSFASNAQQFGGNPPSQKWNQVNTDTLRVIFPKGLDSQANRIAAIIHHMARTQPASLGSQLKKVDIVLQHQTTIPNGYAQLGPFRSEFFMTPPAGSFEQGSIPWADQLAIHEYRHIQQYNNFNHGISKAMRILFGQEGYALSINASIPDWFYEGDAVYMETQLSNQGRGRLPLFLNAYPSLWASGKNYSWMKLRNGSLKDYVPSHYHLGFLMVNYGRQQYGDAFWSKVTRDASAYKGLFYPFQSAIRRHSGADYKTFQKQAFDFYRQMTKNREAEKDDFIHPVNRKYVNNYFFPYAMGNDSLLYLKSTYRHRPAFYVRHQQGVTRLKTRDISIDEQFSYRNGRVVYAAYENDPRWRWRDYSVLKVFDIQSGQQRTITRRSKYFSPDISADGLQVVAVQMAASGKNELHIVSAQTGDVLKAWHYPDVSSLSDPKFLDDQHLVVAMRLPDGKMTLGKVNAEDGQLQRLLPSGYSVLGYPCVDSGFIYFTASYNGNDELFALNDNNSRLYRLTESGAGNYFVNVNRGIATWSLFTAEGYQLKQQPVSGLLWTEMSDLNTKQEAGFFSPVSGTENILHRGITERGFPISKYSKGKGLVNFHSWRPYYEDPILSFSLYGENILNTFQTELYYRYNQNDKYSSAGFNAIYGGAFPFISGGAEMSFNREMPVGQRLRQWNQLDTRLGLILPISKTSGQTFKNFSAGSFYVLRNEFNKGFYKDSLGATSFSYLLHNISWTEQIQRAVQHVFPMFAYSAGMSYRHAITRFEGYQFSANGSLYIPGLLSSHNLFFLAGFQQRDTLGQIGFSNRFAYSRGYTGRYFSRMWKISSNYHFPVMHPDFGVGNIVFIQRIRGNLFYDFTKVYSRDKSVTRDQRSIGVECFADTRWWNQHPLTFGFRVSQLLDRDQFNGFKGTVFEFIMPVSIIPR